MSAALHAATLEPLRSHASATLAPTRRTAIRQLRRLPASAPNHTRLQRQLLVGVAHDPLEREADRTASAIVGGGSNVTTVPASQGDSLQRCGSTPNAECGCHAEGAECVGAEGGPAPSSVSAVLSAPGMPMPVSLREGLESRLGADFGSVRLHTDQRAAASATAVGARAYTVGRDVVFGPGQYAPDTPTGLHTLAHELAHVVQQRGGGGGTVRRKLAVGPGLSLDTKGFKTSKSGDEYTAPAIVKNTIWNELFTALLASPRVFTIAGTTNAEVNANLDKHMNARHGIVVFASKKRYTFAAGAAFRMNPAYWIVDATGFRPKAGVTREDAIKDLNVHPTDYAIACLAATQLTMESAGSPLRDDSAVAPDDWIPGDWGYITNTSFPAAGGTPGLEGENIIYTSKDRFWGHFGPGIEYKSLIEWFDQVKSWNGTARTETFRTRPTIGLR